MAKIITSILAHLFFVQLALAQSVPATQVPIDARLMAEAEVYMMKVLPAMQAARQKLEIQLADSDKQKLTYLIQQTRRVATAPALPFSMYSSRQLGVDETQEQRLRQSGALFDQIKKIAAKYQQPMQKVFDDLEPERKQWEAQLKAIQAASKSVVPRASSTSLLDTLFTPFGFIILPARPLPAASNPAN